MKKYFPVLICVFITTHFFAQQHIINTNTLPANLSDAEISEHMKKVMPRDGWVQIIHENKNGVFNASNPDYFLFIQLNCVNNNPPGFFIEYTDNYRDGEFGGIDFMSADDPEKANFIVDGVDFKNPFRSSGKESFTKFVSALKKGKKLTLKTRNRSIDFKLAHGELLDIPVECSKAGDRIQENEPEELPESTAIGEEVEAAADAAADISK
ncbi:hypothetical protein SAMN05421741_13413 [Paenimyroides ummariense]|uniref:Uncharacterized protein n=1 Tax=Paenimyroides ummariense TaxID=913024 RepID=A0A1I5G1K9_9FLAO|nr:hypothetical protein [Paenimyroides ummariense]SFO29441.1 hypothetical protein SAMN05421741_13413 [Paenimyroides ummariense]